MSSPFDPSALERRDLALRLKVVSGSALPYGWRAGDLPRPALPIDECVQVLLKQRRIQQPPELLALHPLGVCPYAIARHGVIRAALFAQQEHLKQKVLKPRAIEALKDLRDKGPRLSTALDGLQYRVQTLLNVTEQLGLSAIDAQALSDAITSLQNLLGGAHKSIVSNHRELSKSRGNIWRLSFVAALFAEWWILTGKDPKPSAGPCQEFICAAWCSLSPVAAATDADWASAIKVALSRIDPGAWRMSPLLARVIALSTATLPGRKTPRPVQAYDEADDCTLTLVHWPRSR
jgi:hypothetical protein